MTPSQQHFVQIKGMHKDLNKEIPDTQYAYDLQNMRLTTLNEESTLALVNERGTKKIDTVELSGGPIGTCTINNQIVVFTLEKSNSPKFRIYRIYQEDDIVKQHLLEVFADNFNCSLDKPFECISFYENENNQKVYWLDGKNQLRYVNIANKAYYDTDGTPINASHQILSYSAYESTPAFVNTDTSNNLLNVRITKSSTGGYFKAGTIQYVFTYGYKNGAESNVAYISPLYYLTYSNERGLSPEDTSSNSFLFSFFNVNTEFDWINIYSIHRSSLDGTAECRLVERIPAVVYDDHNDPPAINFIDDGEKGSMVNESDILALFQAPFIANTMTEKNNSLILGNISYLQDVKFKQYENEDLWNKDSLSSKKLWVNTYPMFTTDLSKKIQQDNVDGIYPYRIELNNSDETITTFKYLDTYRFGVQLMNKYGNWSNPIWVGDIRNDEHPINEQFYNNEKPTLLPYLIGYLRWNSLQEYLSEDIKAVRPVVVYPTIHDRECIAQGVLNPTVFNFRDRKEGTVFSQASWNFRPYPPVPIEILKKTADISNYSAIADLYLRDLDDSTNMRSANSLYGILNHTDIITVNSTPYLSWIQYMHNAPLFSNLNDTMTGTTIYNSVYRATELQSMPSDSTNADSSPLIYTYQGKLYCKPMSDLYYTSQTTPAVTTNSQFDKYNNWFFVDQSIVTLNSPDIEFDDDLKFLPLNDYQLRITGFIPITGNINSLTINASMSSPRANNLTSEDLFTKYLTIANFNKFGWRNFASQPRWYGRNSQDLYMFDVYLWQQNGSIENADDDYGILKQKYFSSLKFSNNTVYQNIQATSKYDIKPADIQLYDSLQNTPLLLKEKSPFPATRVNYYGNVDSVFFGTEKRFCGFALSSAADIDYRFLQYNNDYITDKSGSWSLNLKYKSSPHIVINLGAEETSIIPGGITYSQNILPRLRHKIYGNLIDEQITWEETPPLASEKAFWDNDKGVYGGIENLNSNILQCSEFDYSTYTPVFGSADSFITPLHGYLWLGEIYNPNVNDDTRFGGKSEEALKQNKWLIAGPVVELNQTNLTVVTVEEEGESVSYDAIPIKWLIGDTYYQRYDCLKTYPYTEEELNMNVEILSFMCETRVNLDGRYDRNRGLQDNTHIRPTNFNLMNPAYNQQNTFAQSRIVDEENVNFPNWIVISQTKNAGEEIDSWTKLDMANSLDLNGVQGSINKLVNFHDSVLAFQDYALSQIYYNEKEQISTDSGLPVQLANSEKLGGYKILFDKIGCTNKWSVCVTSRAVYFIDDNNKSLYMWGGGQEHPINLTDKNMFNSWIRKSLEGKTKWTPEEFGNFTSYFNASTSDVYFVNDRQCLAFNETLGEFSSFYSYEDTPYLQHMGQDYYFIKSQGENTYIHGQHKGEYNSFFEQLKPFSITILANDKGIYDKIFNTVDFRSNSWVKNNGHWENMFNTDFKTIEVWNEYQHGRNELNLRQVIPSELKKKYRIWRANIPRNNMSANIRVQRDRIRNPWTYIKLSSKDEILSTHKTVLNDLMVNSIII